ncbi:MAG: hypothetical protein ACREOZ_02455 [Gloeomargaritales cyanobacterium]
MVGILKARSEDDFNETMRKIYRVLHGRQELIDYMKTFERDRKYFVAYAMDATPGTMGNRGSSIAESNHSSYVARVCQASTDELEVVCKSLLQRQLDINISKNEVMTCSMISKRESVLLSDDGDVQGSMAVVKLSSWGYQRWNEQRIDSRYYVITCTYYVITCTNFASGAVTVCRKGGNAPGRVINQNGRCGCITRVTELIQCDGCTQIQFFLIVIGQ